MPYLHDSTTEIASELKLTNVPVSRRPKIILACGVNLTRIHLSGCLEQAGFEVSLALNGNAAIDAYFQHAEDVDVLLVDADLPDVPAPAFFRRFRGHSPLVPCCFFAPAESQEATEARSLGATVLFWPIPEAQLTAILRAKVQTRSTDPWATIRPTSD